ncbi:hypothetical protein DI005_35690 [Prauserella sp. PE36]|uniref:Uncharacterized protein n=1 Tax=Prauserella endophytica TaxID=1592324 RepID=A0ABY2RSP0_9PSEU|nr:MULTISPECIES: hypothetical protein [Prauserella]PXY26621.1 hypothetical protein BAY59_18320 [Prauserella coralliicola]RBM10542.1 hypothetical protein DI005_35690 [Prauserella sp. PE36]TKG58722.1 hypothetical protein FCN18_37680 [Prauserella endophytica]
MTGSLRPVDRVLLVVLAVDAALLALLEMFFLPLRLDGLILPRAGDVPLPLSVLVALVTTPLLVSAAARLGNRRLGIVPLAVWILTLLLVGVQGPGGDVILTLDWRALVLLAAGALPGALAAGFSLARPGPKARKGS